MISRNFLFLEANNLTVGELTFGLRSSNITFENAQDWSQFYHKVSYRIGKDFKILTGFGFGDKITIDKEMDTDEMKVEEIRTLWSGLCLKMTPKTPLINTSEIALQIVFSNELPLKVCMFLSKVKFSLVIFTTFEFSRKNKTQNF